MRGALARHLLQFRYTAGNGQGSIGRDGERSAQERRAGDAQDFSPDPVPAAGEEAPGGGESRSHAAPRNASPVARRSGGVGSELFRGLRLMPTRRGRALLGGRSCARHWRTPG